MSGSNKWGWSSNDPALCNSHLGCPAIYPNFLMAYEIIRLDRRPIWSVVCSTGKGLMTKGGETGFGTRRQKHRRALLGIGFKCCGWNKHKQLAMLCFDADSHRPTPRLKSSQPSQLNKSRAQGQYSGQCSASGAG